MDMNVKVKKVKRPVDTSIQQDFVKAQERLQNLISGEPNEEAAICLAQELRSLCGQAPGIQEKQTAYAGLEQLWAQYGETHAVLEELAKGIVLLCAGMDEMYSAIYKPRLQGLMWGYPELEKVITEFQETQN